jgi:hypothetical protein
VSDPGVHPIGSVDNAVQHLSDGADHDARDPATGLIDLFSYPFDERIVVFKGALTGIDGVAFADAAIVPEPRPVLLFLARRIEALAKKEWRISFCSLMAPRRTATTRRGFKRRRDGPRS